MRGIRILAARALGLLAGVLLVVTLARAVEPSAAERAWLLQHPVVKVGVSRQAWSPVESIDAEGRYVGVSADYLARLMQDTGLRYEIHVEPDFTTVLAKLRKGELDLAPSAAMTAKRERFLHFTSPYLASRPVLISRKDLSDIDANASLAGRRIAVEQGFPIEDALGRLYPAAQPVRVIDTRAALRALAEGRVDAYVGLLAPAAWVIEHDMLSNLSVRGPVELDDGLRFAVRADARPLADLLNRSIAGMPQAQRDEILRRWTPVPVQLNEVAAPLALGDAAQAWIATHPSVRVGYIADYAPLAERAPDGSMRGLFRDQLDLLARRLGLRVGSLRAYSLAGLQTALREGEIDVAFGLSVSPQREQYAQFVGPLLVTPTVAISRADGAFFHDPAQYVGQRLAIKRGYFLEARLQRAYPGIRLQTHERLEEVLAAVAHGDADAAFTDLSAAVPALSGEYAGVLKVAGTWLDAPSEVHIAVRKDWPELADLFRQALDSLSPSEQYHLRERWLVPRYSFDLPWRRLMLLALPVLGGLLVVFGAVVLWNRRLRAEIDRRRALQAELVAARDAALDAADRLTLFLGALSHEIRTPMNGVTGLVDALSHSPLDDEQRYQLGVVARSARMALEILGDSLDLARAEAGRLQLDPRPTDVRLLAEDVAAMLAPLAAERRLSFQLAVAPELPLLMLDGLRLRQIMANLLTNALRYTERGFVRLEVRGEALGERRWRLRVDVRDSGPGIPEAAQRQLFLPFQTIGAPSQRGTGLGLAISRAMCEAMGGTLELESAPGQGSCFRLGLETQQGPDEAPAPQLDGVRVRLSVAAPTLRNECSAWLRHWGAQIIEVGGNASSDLTLSDGAAALPGQAWVLLVPELVVNTPAGSRDGCLRMPCQPLLPGRLLQAVRSVLAPAVVAEHAPSGVHVARRVLVVDDEPLNLRVARELLALLGFEAVTAGDGQSGFDAFCAERFVAVLLDYRMPGEDGVSLAARMRRYEHSAGLAPSPIVAVTADSTESTASACLSAGMNSILLKPLTLATLHAQLTALGCAPRTPDGGLLVEESDSPDPLAHLAALLGSVDRARAIADGFVRSADSDRLALEGKLEAGDADGIRFLAHRIKGAARNAGFEQVGEAAADLENAARDHELVRCRALLPRLSHSLEHLRQRLGPLAQGA
ncbi:transporter substrate-binding domain-containing protein [Niveibacterium sp. SC-1]|uniref:transporter substrate-binding domain-containing protein n=1 Tax=Niveibacterium sp. SC-1 TaxID=3135646 RepID=UPI00311D3390